MEANDELVGYVPLELELSYLIYAFLRVYDNNEVSIKVTGSGWLENSLVVSEAFKARMPSRIIAMRFEREILRLKENLRPHGHWSRNFKENYNVLVDNESRVCKPVNK